MTASSPGIDRSTFRLLILAVVTLAIVITTAISIRNDASSVASQFEPRPMFVGLDISTSSRLTIRSREAEIEVELNERGDWVVPARAGYPARPGPLLQTIGGLADLELIELKTARADWHHYLGLEGPGDDGEGVEITLYGEDNQVIAAAIVGRQPEGVVPELDGRGRIHVRRPGEAQTWLARGSLSLQTDITAWLATRLYQIDGERVRQVTVRPPASDPYTLARATASDEDFELIDLPVGREILSPYVLEAIGTALSEMDVLDVRPADEIEFGGGFELTYQTFDGMEVVFTLADPEGPDGGWATISARFMGLANVEAADAAQIAEESANINVLADGWAFQLPGFQARQMILELEELLRPEAESVQ